MLPRTSIICPSPNTDSTTTNPVTPLRPVTPPRPKLGFSIDSLVGGLSDSPSPKSVVDRPHNPQNHHLHSHHLPKHAKHFKGLGILGESLSHAGENDDLDDRIRRRRENPDGGVGGVGPLSFQRDFRGEFRTTGVCSSPDGVRDLQHQMENIQQALYHINRNKRKNQHISSSPSSESATSSPSPPARKNSTSPKQSFQKGLGSPRRKTPPLSPPHSRNSHFLQQHLHHHALSPPISSPSIQVHSPSLSSPIPTSCSTLRIPEPIHPLNSTPLSLSLSNSLGNHLTNPLSNHLSFPPFGLPLAALLPQIRSSFQQHGGGLPLPVSQDLHGSLAPSDMSPISSTTSPNLPSGLSPLTSSPSSCFTTAHHLSSPSQLGQLQPQQHHHHHPITQQATTAGLQTQSGQPTHSSLMQQQQQHALPTSWCPTGGGGFGSGALGPTFMNPHGLGTPLPPANLPRQYPVYPWLLTRHNRLFGHRFPGELTKFSYILNII